MLNPQVFLERKFSYLPLFAYTSPDETAFIRWRFARNLETAGFCDVELVPFDWLHPATPQPLIGAVKGVGKVIELTPGLREFAGSLYISASTPAVIAPGVDRSTQRGSN